MTISNDFPVNFADAVLNWPEIAGTTYERYDRFGRFGRAVRSQKVFWRTVMNRSEF